MTMTKAIIFRVVLGAIALVSLAWSYSLFVRNGGW